MSAPPELNVIRKLPENQTCADCLAHSQFGHSNVVVKFRSFVCSDCKSAHQAYSHRVKSVTMSNWTKEEVAELRPENGGSNANCGRTWLAGCSVYDRPKSGDHPDRFKAFVVKAYIDEAFKGREPSAAHASTTVPGSSGAASPLRVAKGPWGPAAGATSGADAHVAAAKPKPAEPEADLLGFSGGSASTAQPTSAASSGDLLFTSAPTGGSDLDLLGGGPSQSSSGFGFMSGPPAAPPSSGFGFIGGNPGTGGLMGGPAPGGGVMKMPGATAIGISFMGAPSAPAAIPPPRPMAPVYPMGGASPFGTPSPIMSSPGFAASPIVPMSAGPMSGGVGGGQSMRTMGSGGGTGPRKPDPKPTPAPDATLTSLVAGLGMGGASSSLGSGFKLDVGAPKPSTTATASSSATTSSSSGAKPTYSQQALAAGLGYTVSGSSASSSTAATVSAAHKAKLDDNLGSFLPFASGSTDGPTGPMAARTKAPAKSLGELASSSSSMGSGSAPRPVMMAPPAPAPMYPGMGMGGGGVAPSSGFGFMTAGGAPTSGFGVPSSGFGAPAAYGSGGGFGQPQPAQQSGFMWQ